MAYLVEVVICVTFASLNGAYGQNYVNLTTSTGPLNGFLDQANSVKVFYGIPFAKSPDGSRRFKPPEKTPSWTTPLNAIQRPKACWQLVDTTFNKAPIVDMWNPNTNMSEDCLYLNLWIPNTTNVKPIMVWIYGGGFTTGSSALEVYDGTVLASRNNVIVASFNYRLGSLGFLYTGTKDSPGNVGLLDQVLALQWIKDNAISIGGDPNKITLFGESAGAVSVGYHLMSNLSKDLFNNAIMMSASPTAEWGIKSKDEAINRTQTFAAYFNCSSQNMTILVSCLQNVSVENLINELYRLSKSYFDVPMAAVVDGYFLHKHPNELLAQGQVKNTSIIVGVVKNEGSYWLAYGIPEMFNTTEVLVNQSMYPVAVRKVLEPFGETYTRDHVRELTMREYFDAIPPWERPANYLEAVENLSGDTLFKCPVVTFAQQYSKNVVGARVFVYSYEHRESNLSWPPWFGAPHGYELGFFFGVPFKNQSSSYLTIEKALSEDVMKKISNFANTNNPNYNGVSVVWPDFTLNEQTYIVLTANKTPSAQGLRYRACDFWTKYVPIMANPSSVVNPIVINQTATNNTNNQGCVRSHADLPVCRPSIYISAFCLFLLVFKCQHSHVQLDL